VSDDLDAYLAHLGQLPFVRDVKQVEASPEEAVDGWLEVALIDGEVVRMGYELRASHLGAEVAERLGTMARSEEGLWILLAPYVGAPLGEALEGRGINFVDRVGNCHVRIGDRHVARVQGRSAPKVPARSKEMRAPGYQVMFAFLAEPELVGRSQREIAEAAGTSRQPVVDLLARFVEEGIVVRHKRRHEWVRPPGAALLERWLVGYRDTLRPRLVVGSFRVPEREPAAIEAWLEGQLDEVRYGGTAGGFRLVGHYRGPKTVVHLGPRSNKTRIRIKALAAEDGDVIWMRHVGAISRRGETARTVHPLLIYGELMADPDPRAGELASLVRERFLRWSL